MPPTAEPARVLVVEDDRKTADLVALYLRHAGYSAFVEHDGARARERLAGETFDLLVLDVMLPRTSGLDLVRELREWSSTPVILLTARTAEEQRIEGLELGADDYVCKPFSPRELVARVNAVLRRAPAGGERVLRWGALAADLHTRGVTLDGRDIPLTRSEFDILVALLERPGRVRRRAELLARITSGGDLPLERTVDVHVRNLRRKLGDDDARIVETVVGVGYRAGPGGTGLGSAGSVQGG